MKMEKLSALAVIAIMIATVLVPAMGMGLVNNSNLTTTPTPIPQPTPTYNDTDTMNNESVDGDGDLEEEKISDTTVNETNATDTDMEANKTEIIDKIPLPELSEHLKIIGNDSFSAEEMPEFVIEIEQDFIDAVANADGEPVDVQPYVEDCNGSRIELFVEEICSNKFKVTIQNNKTGTEEITPGIYTLVVEVGERSVEHTFEWGLEPESEPTNITVSKLGDVVSDSTLTSTSKPVIIMFKDKRDAKLVKQHGGKIKSVYRLKPALAASLPQKAIDALRKNPKIDFVVDDLQIYTMGETLDWGVDRIDADVVHESNNNGTGINVAIMDTGIDYDHPDLAANYEGGYDFGGDYSGAPNDADPMDYGGHGTHCAGIVAAVKGNGIGVIGVAPEADLYAVKVFTDDGNGSYSDVVEALEWCIDTRTDADPNNDIQVISMSFGSKYSAGDPGIESWINATYDAGILLVGAAGNEGKLAGVGDNVGYPARYESVIAVAATDINDNRASFSSTGPAVELATPGVSINSTCRDDTYVPMSGTSMACPMVSGTAALVIASNSSLTNVDVRMRLQETAEDLGAAGKDTKYGYGLVNASEAASPTGLPDEYESPVVAIPRTYDNTTLEEKTVFERNDSMFINVSVTDANGASDLDSVLITILNTTNATILNNDTMTQDTPITDGYVYNYSWKVPGDADSGTWALKVYANDTHGNVGSASVQFVVNHTNATAPENKNITVDLIATKEHFALNENPEFKFIVNYNTTECESKANETAKHFSVNAFSKRVGLKTLATPTETIKTSVYYKDELLDLEPEIEKIVEGDFSIKIPTQRASRAGLYKLKVELVTDNKTYVEEQDFTWGVLAINTHKSIYLPDETAFIGMAVLDNEGHMVCDADVTLTITDPGNKETVLSTSNGLISVSQQCSVYGVTNLPDYYANYTVGGVGTYVMTLTAVTADGTKSITDEFTVQSSVDFDVARSGPTRIYPPVPYVMNFTIKANKDYNGLIKEYVPALFEITPQDGLTVSTIGDTKILSWNKNLVRGEVYNIYYEFDAPDVSPYLFVLGALEIGNWQEARQWMIASDPAGTVNDDSVTASGDKNYNSNEQFTIAVVFHIGSGGGTRTADFNMQLRYGDNTTEGDDAITPLNTSCQDFKFVSVDTSDCNAKNYCTLTDNGDGTVRVQFTNDPAGNSVTITWTVEACPGATTGSYDIDDHVPSTTTGTITLDDWDTVSVTQLIPPKTNETSVNATTVGVNDIICVNHTVTKGTHDIDKTWVEITYPNGTSANITTSNTTGVCGAGGSVYGVEINVGSTTGNLTVNTSWVNDTHGNIDYDDPHPNIIVSVQDLKAPQWSDVQTNKTTIYENDYVKFTANWTDDVALAGYKFAINQSGAWVNSSFVPFSGKSNTSENVTQITASAGTTVQWRFYANDTSDNGNATDIQTFVVQSAEVITPPATPYLIYGRVFYKNGTACNNPTVNITNMNNSKEWEVETHPGYNFYQRILANGTDLNASEILQFHVKAPDASQFNTTNHTVTQDEIDDGGLFSYNITLEAPETPFMIYGWVFYKNDTACNGPTVTINNTNTSITWQAETNASYNYYQLILGTTNVSAGNVLKFNATDGTEFNVTNHTVTQSDINNGGIFDFNLTLLSAADTTPPEWRSQGQNVSQIPTGGSILLYAQGKDTVALDYALLATNETGTWHNWTNRYGSPMDMQDAVNTWKWSNFTWQNGSISAGTIVGWRIWYNDTSDNWNKTDIMCFEVIAGAPPTVDSITITPDDEPSEEGVQINPNAGSNKTVTISAVVSDLNGWEDIDTVVANVTGPSTVADSPVSLDFVSSSNPTTATYTGTFNMSFYYLNGTYTVNVTATDNGSLTGSRLTTFDYQTAVALELDTTMINFSISGPIDPGNSSEVLGDKNMSTLNNATVRNIGNVKINVNVSGTNMTSAGNVITKDNIEARINETSYHDLSVPRCFDVNMTVAELSLENADFKLFVPFGTPQGSYSGTITLTAVQS